ncbi:MAG: polysaccharide deacetylase [Ruminococcaceae bacterium]|nr:polysaccharide deacetylase [Oscillospiraceae bacterium]
MFNGKTKAVTFSFDDGVAQDRRLVEILNRYHLKGTFNISSGRFGDENAFVLTDGKWVWHDGRSDEPGAVAHYRLPKEAVKSLYEGHEVAAHTVNHRRLIDCSDEEVIRQVEEDRLALSEMMGYEVCGMAYPNGDRFVDDRVINLVKEHTGVRYARLCATTGSFSMPEDLYRLQGTLYPHRNWDVMTEIAQKFLELETDEPALLYIWGHAYEFDMRPDGWEKFEEFCRLISGKQNIFYGTNKEVLLMNV